MASGPLPLPVDTTHLSPHHRPRSNSASPYLHPHAQTPDDSISTASHYQSDYGDAGDPFFGTDFNSDGGTPLFLEESFVSIGQVNSLPRDHSGSPNNLEHHSNGAGIRSANGVVSVNSAYPLTPDQTTPPQLRRRGTDLSSTPSLPTSVSPHELQRPFPTVRTSHDDVQLTPNGSCLSSDDGLAPAALLPAQSPLVTVSDWGRGAVPPTQSIERTFSPDTRRRSPSVRSTPGDLMPGTPNDVFPTFNDQWMGTTGSKRQGLGPEHRPKTAVESVNQLANLREKQERNQAVDTWLNRSANEVFQPAPTEAPVADYPGADANVEDDGIPLGGTTENKYEPGQTYYNPRGGEFTPEDIEIIRSNQYWADAPRLHAIAKDGSRHYQPPTAQAAMAQYERLCRDTESIVSVTATVGTARRRSLPSVADLDVDGLSGSILKRLTISRTEPRKHSGNSFFNGFRTLVRKPSSSLKRSLSSHDEAGFPEGENEKQDNTPHLAPPPRTSSWGKKQTPNITSALISMGNSVAAVGAGQAHNRSGSVSATSATHKSPFGGLSVKTTLRRPRSKSDLPRPGGKSATDPSPSNSTLADLWKRTGGPPVATLATSAMPTSGPPSANVADLDDDDDDDDDSEDSGVKAQAGNIIDSVPPTFEGFKSYVQHLNPSVPDYLADRIAHQQLIRFKSLLNMKLNHIKQGRSCTSGPLCIALGGSARILDQKGETRAPGSLISPDSDLTPVEGVISQDSFPQDIPMPPTALLPAVLECQLCFLPRKCQKPSDWTKHVHEDVQPFTCTWERCKDPKIFKRKADWVRHENEGHRHLEWWKCDVDDCAHVCYRRDNFLQHLVREHKIEEPRARTKAAMKRAGGGDPVWQRVERCHEGTGARAVDEPCRFCGKAFPTWKKLTVHLAKHMEQISLPILRLVAAREVNADTVISPVQDPPMPYPPLPVGSDNANALYSPGGYGNEHHGQQTGMESFQDSQPGVYGFPSQSTSFQDSYLNQFGPPLNNGIDPNGAGGTSYDPQPYLHASDGQPAPGIQRVRSMPVQPSAYADENGYLTPTVAPPGEVFVPAGLSAQGYFGLDGGVGMGVEGGYGGSVSPYASSYDGSPGQGGFYHQ